MPILIGTLSAGFAFKKSEVVIGKQDYNPVAYNEQNNDLIEDPERIWQTLPSFYRNFLQNKEVFQTVWKGVRILLGSEILKLFQYSYNSGSKEAVRLFQRKWQSLNFNKQLSFGASLQEIGDASSSVVTINSSGAYYENAGESYLRVLLSDSTNIRSDLVFTGDIYSEEQYVNQDGSLSWDFEFVLPDLSNSISSFLIGYLNVDDQSNIFNSIVCGIAKSGSSYRLYAGHIDSAGNITEVLDASYSIEEDEKYKITAEYFNRNNELVVKLEQDNAVLYPSYTSVSLTGTFDSSGIFSTSYTGLSFQGLSIPIDIIISGSTFQGTINSSGIIEVADKANTSGTITLIRPAAAQVLPVDAGTSLFTNKFKLAHSPQSSFSDLEVGDKVEVFSNTMVDTDGDGIADSIIAKSSRIKAIDFSTNEVTLEASIISNNIVPKSTMFPDGVVPELVTFKGFTDKIIDINADGIPDSEVRIVLDIVGSATDYKFSANAFGAIAFNGNSLFPIASGPIHIYSWNYSWPLLPNVAVFLPSMQPNILSDSGKITEGNDYSVSGKLVQFNIPNRSKYYAEYIAFDENTLYDNFGVLVGLKKESSTVEYRAKVRALLFSLYSGPTITSIKSGFGLFLGLPITESAGTVVTINDSFSSSRGQIVIQDNTANLQTYYYPKTAGTSLSVGDTVSKFQLLADGVDLHDYISSPKILAGTGISEVEKFHTFLLDFNLSKLSPSKLPDAVKFVDKIKPTFKNKIVRGFLEELDELEAEGILEIDVTADFIDPFCSSPQPRYDSRTYADQFDYDYAYDQFATDFQPTSGLSSINSGQDGVPSSVIIASRDYTHYQLSVIHGNNTLREFITGIIQLSNLSATATGAADSSGASTDFVTEISPVLSSLSAGQELFLILHPYFSGSGARATQFSNLLSGVAGDFDDLEVGDRVVLKGLQIDTNNDGIVDTDSVADNGTFMVSQTFGAGADKVELTHAFVNRPTSVVATYTNINWYAYKDVATAVKIDSVTNASELVLRTACPSVYPGNYLATLANPDFVAVYYDYFEETCPNEQTTLHFGTDFSHSNHSSSTTAVFSPIGLSYPQRINSGTDLSSSINYSQYSSFARDNRTVTIDSANPNIVTIAGHTRFVGQALAFPLIDNSLTRRGLTATQDGDTVVFKNETIASIQVSPNPHNMGFSWHRIIAKNSANEYEIYPEFSSGVSSQVTLTTVLSVGRAQGFNAVGTIAAGNGVRPLTFKYGANATPSSSYDNALYASFVTGLFLLAIKKNAVWNSATQDIDLILQILEEPVPTSNPDEFLAAVRIWNGTSHSDILSSYTHTSPPEYILYALDFSHPFQQETPFSEPTAVGFKKGMSEIFDKFSASGSVHNPTEILTPSSNEDGVESTIVEATP